MGNGIEELATFAATLKFGDLPSAVQSRVKAITIDTLASAIAGRNGDETTQIEALGRALGDHGHSTVLGGRPASSAAAALINGYQVTAVTVCDIYRPALCHVTPEVVPPALIVAEQRGSTGPDLLAAIAAGLETTTRIGRAVNYQAFRDRGWHSPGVIGPFGGAAAAGRLLGLDPLRQRHAFGLAGSQAAGTFAHWGTPTIKFHQARGSLSGLMAAFLAEQGFLSAADVLANPDGGLFHAYSDGGSPDLLDADLGQDWELDRIGLRRWPAASSIQTMITSLFALLAVHPLDPADIEQVSVELSPTVFGMHGALPWSTKFSAQLSAPFVTAVVLHDRQCWLDQFTPERITDPRLDEFARQQVTVTENRDLSGTSCVIRIHTTDGRVLEDSRSVPKGDADDPLTMSEVEEKFREAGHGVLDGDVVEQALELWGDIENCRDVTPLVSMLGRA
ncbi:MmgE/PrpD family protein [Mycolicibacterium sp.]|uniref:MmgE/PrpD family protein n=1 Tax=Mycolicibacterium sp. TaxID=2320850 RepID=UPI003D133E17